MYVIHLTQYNTRCYGISFQNNACIKVQNFADISDDEKKIFCVKPLEIFSGKSQICDKTLLSGALDKSVVDENTMLLKISGENDKHRYA